MVFTCFPGQGLQFGQQGHLTMGCSGSTEWQGQNDKSIFSFRKAIVMDDCVGSLSVSWAFTSGIALKTERNAPWVSAGMCECETGEQLGVVGTDSYSWTLHWAYAVNRRGRLWEKLHTAVSYFFCMCPSIPLWAAGLWSTQALRESTGVLIHPLPLLVTAGALISSHALQSALLLPWCPFILHWVVQYDPLWKHFLQTVKYIFPEANILLHICTIKHRAEQRKVPGKPMGWSCSLRLPLFFFGWFC